VKRVLPFLMALGLGLPLGADEPKKAEEAEAAPRIAVEPASFDFGKAVQNKTLSKEFSIKNYGTADLVIENVTTTCGCTVTQLDTKVVKPGATTPLRVALETRTASGRIQRSVMIRSNDPKTALLELKVEATVAAPSAK
jgi:hypothetical protein